MSVLMVTILFLGLFLFLKFYTPPLSKNNGKVDAQLFIGDSENQPLIVAFGGSQGGNTWPEPYWSEMRYEFLNQGYAVLSIGYFNTEGTPETLDRISLDAIYATIKNMCMRLVYRGSLLHTLQKIKIFLRLRSTLRWNETLFSFLSEALLAL